MSSSGLNAQVLTVERDPTRRAALRQALVEGGYEVLEAESCDGALHVLARRKIACVVATGDPADGSAAERVGRILRSEPAMAIVVLASDADVAVAIAAMRAGAMEYLGPDVSPAEVTLAVDQAVDRRRALAQDQEVARSLGIEVGRLTAELRRERSRGDQVALAALESLVYVVEAKDLWLAGHSVRVAQMAASIAAELEHSDEEIEQIRIAGRLHDIGMVSVSEFILSKEGPLSPEEFDKVRAHVTLGSQILSPLPGSPPSPASSDTTTSVGTGKAIRIGSPARRRRGAPGSSAWPRSTTRSPRPDRTRSPRRPISPSNTCRAWSGARSAPSSGGRSLPSSDGRKRSSFWSTSRRRPRPARARRRCTSSPGASVRRRRHL